MPIKHDADVARTCGNSKSGYKFAPGTNRECLQMGGAIFERRLRRAYENQKIEDPDPDTRAIDEVEKQLAQESRDRCSSQVQIERHIEADQRRSRWANARRRPADQKSVKPAPAKAEPRLIGRGGRRTSHRVGRASGDTGRSASSDDGGGEPPHPPLAAGSQLNVYDVRALAERWQVSHKTLQNQISAGARMPLRVSLPGCRGPRWLRGDVENFELEHRQAPPSRKRGRPRAGGAG